MEGTYLQYIDVLEYWICLILIIWDSTVAFLVHSLFCFFPFCAFSPLSLTVSGNIQRKTPELNIGLKLDNVLSSLV